MSPFEEDKAKLRWLVDFNEQLTFLEDLKNDSKALREWLERALQKDTCPFLLDRTAVCERLLELFPRASVQLQQELAHSVVELIRKWLPSHHQASYLSDLLELCGNLAMTDAYQYILALLRQEVLKGVFPSERGRLTDMDLHVLALQAIGPFYPEDSKLFDICERDILESRYFSVCYHIMLQLNKKPLLKYFPRLVRLCIEGRYFFQNEWLYLKSWQRELCLDFQAICEQLNPLEQNYLVASLFYVRDTLNPEMMSLIRGLHSYFHEICHCLGLDLLDEVPLETLHVMLSSVIQDFSAKYTSTLNLTVSGTSDEELFLHTVCILSGISPHQIAVTHEGPLFVCVKHFIYYKNAIEHLKCENVARSCSDSSRICPLPSLPTSIN